MYGNDLSHEEWRLIERHFQRTDKRGAVPTHATRDIVKAILYVSKAGAQWQMSPKEFPPWQTVYDQNSTWNRRRV